MLEIHSVGDGLLGVVHDEHISKWLVYASIIDGEKRIMPVSVLDMIDKHIHKVLGIVMGDDNQPVLHSDKLWFEKMYDKSTIQTVFSVKMVLENDRKVMEKVRLNREDILFNNSYFSDKEMFRREMFR